MLNDGFGPTGMVFLDFHTTLPLSLHVAISRKISTTCIALTWMHFLFVARKCNCSTEGVLLLMRYTVRALRFFTGLTAAQTRFMRRIHQFSSPCPRVHATALLWRGRQQPDCCSPPGGLTWVVLETFCWRGSEIKRSKPFSLNADALNRGGPFTAPPVYSTQAVVQVP